MTCSPARLPAAVLLCILLAGLVWTGLPTAAMAREPWIFVRIGGEDDYVTFHPNQHPRVELSDKLNSVTSFTQGPAADPDFFYWIATHQENYDKNSCMGRPFPDLAKTARNAELHFTDAFDWYLHHGFDRGDFKDRPHGPFVLAHPGSWFSSSSVKPTGKQVSYFFCDGGGGYMGTLSTFKNHRIMVGSDTADMNSRPPVFFMSAAHELTHLVQDNLVPLPGVAAARKAQSRVTWIIEGTADAAAMFATNAHFKKKVGKTVTPAYGPFSDRYYRRFFLSRAYNIPLNFRSKANRHLGPKSYYSAEQKKVLRAAQAIDKTMLEILGYKTNGFWYHVIERYLHGHPAGLKPLYRKLTTQAALDHPTRVVDKFLDTIDGNSMTGLEHVFPQFLTEYATWWHHRFKDHPISRSKWERLSFNGCETASLSRRHPARGITLQLAAYAGDCFKVFITPDAARLNPDLQIKTTAADNGADEVYLGKASAKNLADSKRNTDCYEAVTRQKKKRPAPCLLGPTQGDSSSMPQMARLFTVFQLKNVKGKPVRLEFVASRVPKKMPEVGRGLRERKIFVSLSLDFASSTQSAGAGGGTGAPAGGDGASGDGGERPAVPHYGAKNGRGKIMSQGSKTIQQASLRDFMAGRVTYVPKKAAPFLDKQITVAVGGETDVKGSPGDGYADVTFMLPRNFAPGDTGDLKVMAMSASDKDGPTVGYQNPDQPSHLRILEYSDDTLRFAGVAHLCEGNMADLMSIATAGEKAKLCDVLPKKTYKVSGAIAYPMLRNSAGRLQSHDTPAFRDYLGIKTDQIVGPDDSETLMDFLKTVAPDAARKLGKARGVARADNSGGRTPHTQCHLREPSGACNCSCAAKACQRRHPEEAKPECRLVCAVKWRQCNG